MRKSIGLKRTQSSAISVGGSGGGSAILSPYAKALKQVAVRGGAAALGPTAREQELRMYAAGTLPADYKPPVQGQWDETVERWAYAWQYPSMEEAEESDAFRISKDAELIQKLKDFGGFLEDNSDAIYNKRGEGGVAEDAAAARKRLDAPQQQHNNNIMIDKNNSDADGKAAACDEELSMLRELEEEGAGGGGEHQTATLPQQSGGSEVDMPPRSSPSSSSKMFIAAHEEDILAQLSAAAGSVGGREDGNNTIMNVDDNDQSAVSPSSSSASPLLQASARMMGEMALSSPYTVETVPSGIPAAYLIDYRTPTSAIVSNLSLRLGQILSDDMGLAYDEEGITTVLHALAYANDPTTAKNIFLFATKRLGFAVSATMYNALLYCDAQLGNVNPVMRGIEEMKAMGITPIRHTWHLLMLGFTKARDYPAVSQVVDNMKSYANIEPDEVTFALQLYALSADRSKENNVAEALQLFDQMENVYGFVPSRPHYHSLMKALATKKQTALREQLEMLGTKMEILGIPWNPTTYTIHMRAAQLWGDVPRIRKLFAKLRDDGVAATPSMYAWAIRAHANAMRLADYDSEVFRQSLRTTYKIPSSSSSSSSPDQPLIAYWVDQMTLCYSVIELLERRNEVITDQLINSLLFAVSSALMLAMEHTPDAIDTIMRFEEQATAIWDTMYDRHGVEKSVHSYHVYITMLAHQQRVDLAEKLFQDIVLQLDKTPLSRTYEVLMFMHLSSGEEGGTARALQYMEAMERSKMPIHNYTLKRFVTINNEAGYKRDMKRRARRIMQAREEYMARKKEKAPFDDYVNNNSGKAKPDGDDAEGDGSSSDNDTMNTNNNSNISTTTTTVSDDSNVSFSALAPNPTDAVYKPDFTEESAPSQQLRDDDGEARGGRRLKPLPIDPNSTLAWWHKWRRESISKHDLFATEEEGEEANGFPRGEKEADRRAALTAMGIEPSAVNNNGRQNNNASPSALAVNPKTMASKALQASAMGGEAAMAKEEARRKGLLPLLRQSEGGASSLEGSLWAMDGAELSYPKDGGGPDGWGVQLWRERKLLQKEYQDRVIEGRGEGLGSDGNILPDFSPLGVGARVANDQLSIQEAGLKNPADLVDYRQYPNHVYDDGTLKPASEMSHAIAPSAELVWKREASDPLSVYKTEDELSLEAENTFFAEAQLSTKSKIKDAIEAIRNREEFDTEVVGKTLSKRGKHDYLDKWRQLYSHGTLEVPDEPIVKFGRSVPSSASSSSSSPMAMAAEGGSDTSLLSQSIRSWYKRNKKQPLVGASVEGQEAAARRAAERVISKASLDDKRDQKTYATREGQQRRR